MLEILLIISSLVLFTLFFYVIIRSQLYKTRRLVHQYLIHFDHVNHMIDLKNNRSFLEYVDFIEENQEGIYSVRSRLSDSKLKEIIMAEYHLTLSQVYVQLVPGNSFSFV